ncbi:MAG TPA: hypothetical protein VJU78_03110 [Chitinophagaceae bacterium]|nr:hypothetical protein [Chitinophagaceae bacterium]
MATYNIEGRPFLLDLEKNHLRELSIQSNIIDFDEMQYRGTHYFIRYDVLKSTSPALRFKNSFTEDGLKIPLKVAIDPKGMSERYKFPLLEIAGKNDFDIIVNQDLLRKRLSGELPEIDIAGKYFIADFNKDELRLKDDSNFRINLNAFYYDTENGTYKALYNLRTCTIEVINDKVKEIPTDVVLLDIPSQFKVDPVGLSEWFNLDLKDTLIKSPLQERYKAEVTPLNENIIALAVRSNQQKEALLQKTHRPGNENARLGRKL